MDQWNWMPVLAALAMTVASPALLMLCAHAFYAGWIRTGTPNALLRSLMAFTFFATLSSPPSLVLSVLLQAGTHEFVAGAAAVAAFFGTLVAVQKLSAHRIQTWRERLGAAQRHQGIGQHGAGQAASRD